MKGGSRIAWPPTYECLALGALLPVVDQRKLKELALARKAMSGS
jgi:hypothetical protein